MAPNSTSITEAAAAPREEAATRRAEPTAASITSAAAAAVAPSAPVASANSCRPRVLLPPDADALGTLIAP